MITCMILGMGVPSIPAYIITATIAAPALSKLGIPPISAHMFAFYYAMFANLTPPVALAAFAAAGLSGGSPMKTGVQAVKLAIAGFIVPFMFIYSPGLLLVNIGVLSGLRICIGACLGVLLIASSVEGYFLTKVPLPIRLTSAAGSLCLIHAAISTDLIGLAALALLLLTQWFTHTRKRAVGSP
jgi:TRAP-type uncharacterized transport system fused permease subunit